MKKVVITGAKGLIGKEAIGPLIESGFDVVTLDVNLFDYEDIEKLFAKVKPEHLLHFAWVANEDYLVSALNYKLYDASLNMLRVFEKHGGRRAVFAGTCFEYKFQNAPLKEDGELNPTTVYAQCKNELRKLAQDIAYENGLSFGWGRIFYVLGHGEFEKRLTPYVINSLRNDQKVVIKSGSLIRDYMYTKDIAGAFVKFLDSDVNGCVNICNGKGLSIKDFTLKIAQKLNKQHLLEFVETPSDQPPIIVGDSKRLNHEVGYLPTYTLDEAINKILVI